MRALVAFDKFKDSMSAQEACAVAASAIRKVKPSWEIELCPITDGSDGFASILSQKRSGELIYATVMGPMFKPVEAHFALVECSHFSLSSKAWLRLPDKGQVAVIEMAQTCGLGLLTPEERNLWYTSSYGLGEILRVVLELKPELIIIGLGGAATHDLGIGALEALGLRFRAENGEILSNITPHSWSRVVAIEGSVPTNLPRIILAPNTHNKLLGSRGAAAVFGPAKGLKKSDFQRLEEQTQRMAELLVGHFGASRSIIEVPGSGAAGGASVGLQAAMKIEMSSGVELADRWLRLNEAIEKANVIITGEGKFDLSSMEGKAPQYVIERSSNRGKRIFCLVGQHVRESAADPIEASKLKEAKVQTIAPMGTPPEDSIKNAIRYLSDAVKSVIAPL